MEPDEIKKILSAVGISGAIITVAFIIGGGAIAYRTYLETIKLKLEITQIRNELGKSA